jgi:hypothetical protein
MKEEFCDVTFICELGRKGKDGTREGEEYRGVGACAESRPRLRFREICAAFSGEGSGRGDAKENSGASGGPGRESSVKTCCVTKHNCWDHEAGRTADDMYKYCTKVIPPYM